MTEEEWLSCRRPPSMLGLLRGKASDRKLRLFACACCRRNWDLVDDHAGVSAVVVAERYADGLAIRDELLQAQLDVENAAKRAWAAYENRPGQWLLYVIHGAIVAASYAVTLREDFLQHTSSYAAQVYSDYVQRSGQQTDEWRKHKWEEYAAQAPLLRDIIGNPFRPVTLAPAWLTSTCEDLNRIPAAAGHWIPY